MPRRSTIYVQMPHTWLGRVLALILSAAVLVLAFFFFTIAMAAAGVLVLVLMVRMLWPGRKTPRQAGRDAIEGEFRIEPEERQPPDAGPNTKQ